MPLLLTSTYSKQGRLTSTRGDHMKKKPQLEADLDPQNTRHTRPGSKIAEIALKNSRAGGGRKRRTAAASRPGATGSAQAVRAAKRKRAR